MGYDIWRAVLDDGMHGLCCRRRADVNSRVDVTRNEGMKDELLRYHSSIATLKRASIWATNKTFHLDTFSTLFSFCFMKVFFLAIF